MKLETGRIVRSISGRDAERFYLVLSMDTDGYARIADGKRHRLEKPKRKIPRHLRCTARSADPAAYATNPKLRRLLAAYNDESCAPAAGGGSQQPMSDEMMQGLKEV